MSRRGIDLCRIQDCRQRGAAAGVMEGKDLKYKCFQIGNKLGTGGVGLLQAERWIDKVFDVKRVSDGLMMIRMIVGEVVTVLSIYTPQSGLITEKELFYDSVQNLVQTINYSETLLIMLEKLLQVVKVFLVGMVMCQT